MNQKIKLVNVAGEVILRFSSRQEVREFFKAKPNFDYANHFIKIDYNHYLVSQILSTNRLPKLAVR